MKQKNTIMTSKQDFTRNTTKGQTLFFNLRKRGGGGGENAGPFDNLPVHFSLHHITHSLNYAVICQP